ncbi:MAG: hypothetical protein M1823_003975 [Watsoniomyces obsoletus]|nr:MAG: hypothetical protein M1823_003975 [Watsoniomyces obsoletus]
MAEALVAFGAAGSALQICDVALRCAREIHGFLSDLKDASKDVQHLRSALNDVISIMKNLSSYIAEFSSSANARQHFEVLPEAIVDAVQGFHDDVTTLKEFLPSDLSTSLRRRIRFVFDHAQIRKAIRKLEHRKTTVLLALEIVGRREDIKERNAQRIENALAMNAERFIQHGTSAFESIHAKLDQLHQDVQRDQDLQMQSHSLLEPVSTCIATLNETNTKVDSLATSLNALKLPSQDVSTSAIFQVSDEGMLGRIIRAELQSVLPPIVERMSKPQTQMEQMLRALGRTIDSISQEVSRTAATQKSFDPRDSDGNQVLTHSAPPLSRLSEDGLPNADQQPKFSPDFANGPIQHQQDNNGGTLIASRKRKPAMLWKQTWSFGWRIGCLLIKLSTFRDRGISGVYFDIEVTFIPSSEWMALPGISASYTDAPNEQGYYQICPLISIVPIIPEAAPVWKCVREGDLEGLQDLFAKGLASPRDQDKWGYNLLMCAALAPLPEVSLMNMFEFLLREGADPSHMAFNGWNPMGVLILRTLLVTIREFEPYDLTWECLRLLGDRVEDDVQEETVNVFVCWSLSQDTDVGPPELERLPRLLRDCGQKFHSLGANEAALRAAPTKHSLRLGSKPSARRIMASGDGIAYDGCAPEDSA